MRNGIVLLCLLALVVIAILAGGGNAPQSTRTAPTNRAAAPQVAKDSTADDSVPLAVNGIPHIGSVQVLNGCGGDRAADLVADFLRDHGFDVKSRGNAPTWNYTYTVVVSRTTDMRNARKVAHALSTDKVVIVRTRETSYDVVVCVGSDYKERIRP